jgi:hypothetical protein
MHTTKLSAIRSLTLTTLPACSAITEVTHRLPNLRAIIIDVPGGRPIVRFKELPEYQHPSFARKVLQSDFYMRKISNLPLISAGVPPMCRVLFVVELKIELILEFPGRCGERLISREVNHPLRQSLHLPSSACTSINPSQMIAVDINAHTVYRHFREPTTKIKQEVLEMPTAGDDDVDGVSDL